MRYLAAILLLVAASLLLSCDHKEIVCPYGEQARIEVLYNWEKAPDASPRGMALYFYPRWEGGKIWRFDLPGRDGGPVEIPCGSYSLVTCNNDRPGVRFTETGSASTIAAQAPVTGKGPVLGSTGMLYSATVAEIDVTPCGVSYRTPQGVVKDCPYGVIRCAPDSLATLYTVVIRNIKGLELARDASVALNGVGSSITLAGGQAAGVPSALAFGLDRVGAGPELRGSACGFAPGNPQSYSLRVTVSRKDGTTIARDFPATQLKVNTLSRHNVIIVTEGLDIPGGDIPADPGGIEVGVEGWTVIETDISSDLSY